jgi:hypothetical protein
MSKLTENGLLKWPVPNFIPHMEFGDLPEPPGEGWTRVYVIETHGWCKDMDLYTRTGDTIEPVPGRGKRDRCVDRLHRLYNTRYLSGRE